jgi:hypothetical protein
MGQITDIIEHGANFMFLAANWAPPTLVDIKKMKRKLLLLSLCSLATSSMCACACAVNRTRQKIKERRIVIVYSYCRGVVMGGAFLLQINVYDLQDYFPNLEHFNISSPEPIFFFSGSSEREQEPHIL